MTKSLRASSVYVRSARGTPRVVVVLDNGSQVSMPVERIDSFRRRTRPRQALKGQTPELFFVRVEDDGFTVAWPDLDVDFDVVEMLPVYLGFGQTSHAVARRAGATSSPAKAAASRLNGAKGGRPRKAA